MRRRFAFALILVAVALPSTVFAKGRVYISADMEGIAGVVTGEQLGPTGFVLDYEPGLAP